MALHSVVAPKIDIVNKDSPIVSLTLINQKTITLTTNHTQAAILFDHYFTSLEPSLYTFRNIHLGAEGRLGIRGKNRCWSTGRRLERTERHLFGSPPPGSGCSS